MVLESPLAFARMVLHDDRAAALVHALARPATARELAAASSGLKAEAAAPLLGLLVAAGMAAEVERRRDDRRGRNTALQCWEFHDLLFHARSRVGRHDAPVGGTYRTPDGWNRRRRSSRPRPAETIDLYRPDLEKLEREDPPFARVLERRRSIREYAAASRSRIGNWANFCSASRGSRTARSGTVRDAGRPDAGGKGDAARIPAGGGLYELEVYAVVRACRDLAPGLYHYDPAGHRLERLAGPNAGGRGAAVRRGPVGRRWRRRACRCC